VLEIAKVTGVHPEAHAVDIVLLRTKAVFPMVQVMAIGASTNTGVSGLATPTAPRGGDKSSVILTHDRDTYAIVGFVCRAPVVVGFLYPQVCQMLFEDMNRHIERHPSDVYTSVDGAGNVELYHPSGTYLRIGTSPNHEDLTGKDFDKQWKITKNVDSAPYVHLTVANAGSPVASIDIDPAGNITEQNNGNLSAKVGGNVTVIATGSASVTAEGDMALQSPHITLNTPLTTFTGLIEVLNEGGSSGDVGIIHGTMHITGGDVIADTIRLKTHEHTGVTPGGALSGPPQS
jgi:hypothetical protein